jgi:hypothetical protein
MKEVVEETYRGGNISVTTQQELCAHFSFDITDPSGHKQTVKMGGDNERRALERARGMVDMEIDFAGEN